MAHLRCGATVFDADLVAFDKDGTLIAFDAMWGRLAEAWVEYLTRDTAGEALAKELCASLGYDRPERRTHAEGPLAIATTNQLQTIVAATLYRSGLAWTAAEDRARAAFGAAAALPLAQLVKPAADVRRLFAKLEAAGVAVAVVTTDNRGETEETLRILDVAEFVDCLVCGDDGLPPKPAPHMLLAACRQLGIGPDRTAVVGDTMGDLLMAQRAGAGLRVAVLTGAGDPRQLSAHADVLLPSIDDISVGADL